MKLTGRKFGVEIEFLRKEDESDSTAFNRICRELNNVGIICRAPGYTHETTSYWKIITDASCGLELVSPVLKGESGLEDIEKVCKVLNALGYNVDKSCGLHVHHDARDLTSDEITAVFGFAMKWESVIDYLVSPSRHNNDFCRSNLAASRGSRRNMDHEVLTSELQTLRERGASRYGDNNYNRYLKVNYQAYLRHGTIEFRQHRGTLDSDKITAWVVLTQNFVTRAIESKASWTVSSDSAICFKRFRDTLGCTGAVLENNRFVVRASKVMLERFATFTAGSNITAYTSLIMA